MCFFHLFEIDLYEDKSLNCTVIKYLHLFGINTNELNINLLSLIAIVNSSFSLFSSFKPDFADFTKFR